MDKRVCRRGSILCYMNMDAQDAQDERDESLLQEKPAPAMIACEIADTQDYKRAVS